jgi:ABC-type transport system involved in multi-copper enzyme maturation permease subunit
MTVLDIARDQVADLRSRRLLVVLAVGALLVIGGFCYTQANITSRMAQAQPHFLRMGAGGEERGARLLARMEMASVLMETAMYTFVSIAAAVFSLVIFCTLVSAEQWRGSIQWVLAKPISRGQFLLGKWLGACATLVVFVSIMSAVLVAYSWYAERSVRSSVGYSCLLIFFQSLLVGSVGVALSMVLPPALAGVLAYFAGGDTLLTAVSSRSFTKPLYYLLPSYGEYGLHQQFLTRIEITPARVLVLAAYALAYASVMLWLAHLAFRRRELC